MKKQLQDPQKSPLPKTAQLMFGLQGMSISEQEKLWLNHPLCAGVILFTRNYKNKQQIKSFIAEIRSQSKYDLLIAVDHEGGRVQRFKQGFTHIPPMSKLGSVYNSDSQKGLDFAYACGQVLAYELVEVDIDFSFAPVLDIQTDFSMVIGDRAFHSNPKALSSLAKSFYRGVKGVGMASVGKHFPGHGNVIGDSHLVLPSYQGTLSELEALDIQPFKALIADNIEAIMPAHVVYPQCDSKMPAGFSDFWLKTILREQLQFKGCIISDDLDMAGAAAYGDVLNRLVLAQKHCDLLLLCNDSINMQRAFEQFQPIACDSRQYRLGLLKRKRTSYTKSAFNQALHVLQSLAN